MPRAFRIYPIEAFPERNNVGEAFSTEYQRALPLGLGEDDQISSRIEFLGLSEHDEYTKYKVLHERIKTLRVRFQNNIRDSVITIIEFNIFLRRGGRFLWVDSPKHVEELFERVQGVTPNFSFTPRRIDLGAMGQAMAGEIVGGWFKRLRVAHVSTAAIFGAGVTESADWARYQNNGEISALTINADTDVGQMTFQVTYEGTIVLFPTFAERLQLDILDGLNEIVRQYEVQPAR